MNDETEKAAVFCLAELDRQKGGGFFKKQESEKIVFVSKTYYPFWVIPFRNLTLLFDGLDLSSHTITHPSFPDFNTFTNNLSQLASSRQAYASFLFDNLNYFQSTNGEQTKIVEGLISDADFLVEFMAYAKETVVTNATVDGVLISPSQDEKQIEENVKAIESLYSYFKQELEQLNEIIKALNKQTQQALNALREEIKATEDKFVSQIEKVKIAVEEKRTNINKEYSDKVTEASDKFDKELVAVHTEIISLQRTSEQTNSEVSNTENEIKTAVVNKDEDTEQKLKEKRNELKKQFPDIMTKIKNLEVTIQETEENKKNALFQLKQENDTLLREAGKDLIDIESSRDAEIRICKDEMEKIEDLTSSMIGKIDQLTKISETTIAAFENLGIRHETASAFLVYMPFYLTCYQSGQNKRCASLAPSIASDGSIGAKLRSIGKKKITQLLQPRSQKLISVLNGFLRMLDENVAFNHEINEACSKSSLLGSKDQIELIKKGLSQLKSERWLSDSEFESVNQILS
jgi:hypothetical protein